MSTLPRQVTADEILIGDRIEVTDLISGWVRTCTVSDIDKRFIWAPGFAPVSRHNHQLEYRLLWRGGSIHPQGTLVSGTQLLALPPSTVARRVGATGKPESFRWVVCADGKKKFVQSPTRPERKHETLSGDLMYFVEFVPTQHGNSNN